jgi:hypothetical protein
VKTLQEVGMWVKAHPFKLAAWLMISFFMGLGVAFVQDQPVFYWFVPVACIAFGMFLLMMNSSYRKDVSVLRATHKHLHVWTVIISMIMCHVPRNGEASEGVASLPCISGDDVFAPNLGYTLVPTDHSAYSPTEQNVGGYVVGGAVIVGGAWAAYKFYKFCQRKFPKEPKDTNSLSGLYAQGDTGGGDESAMATAYSSFGSCYVPPDNNLTASSSSAGTPTLFHLSGEVLLVNGTLEFRVSGLRKVVGEDIELFQDVFGFKRDLASHGISMGDTGIGTVYYGKNGRPATPDQVPLSFDSSTKTFIISNGQPSYEVVVQKSYDLETWESMIRTKIPVGQRVRFEDVSESSQTFYRLVPVMSP